MVFMDVSFGQSAIFSFGVYTNDGSPGAAQTAKFRDGTIVPAIGQGSWHIRQGRQMRPPHDHSAIRY
jgi:hypothetical protein